MSDADRPSIEDAAHTLNEHARRCWPRVVCVGVGSTAIHYYYDHKMKSVPPQQELTEWQGWPVVMVASGQMRFCSS